ncbi:MAG: heme ABC transporter ATP-binding protein [Bacteroidota bacterium]
MIELNNITVQMSGKTLVESVSLTVTPGSVTALVGPNGAGKSTLLRVATGEWQPNGGEVRFDGKPLKQWSAKEQAQRRAVVSQHSSLTFPFAAFEVVLMGRTPHLAGRSESRRDMEIAWEALDRVGLAALADQSYTTLSGGERQRVDLARALAQIADTSDDHARYLFLDEPTASLDLAHQHTTLRTARDVAAQGIGVLVILHDLNLAAQYADDIIMLSDGQRRARGAPQDVLTPELIESVFSIPVMVMPHPYHDCPLVVPIAQAVA